MSKRKETRSPEESARRKLAKAQAEFHVAQEMRSQVVAKGEQQVEKVRVRVDRAVCKATERVERRASAMARAEARLLALQTRASRKHGRPERAESVKMDELRPDAAPVATPEEVAKAIAELSQRSIENTLDQPVVVPDGAASEIAIAPSNAEASGEQ